MKVTLVGTNVEIAVLEDALQGSSSEVLISPEPIAAAYARISRSPKNVAQLRDDARKNVGKARKSNQAIVFDMGHSSIAEHAVFNFDLEGVSRLAIEEVEHSRLASFTERSQRYVLLDEDYLVPDEVVNDRKLVPSFNELVRSLFEDYRSLYELLLEHHVAEAGGRGTGRGRRDLETKAKEDARYVLPLATTGQVGMTINARSLAGMARRLKAAPLAEARNLGMKLEQLARRVAPSLVRYTEPTPAQESWVRWEEELREANSRQPAHDVAAGTLRPHARLVWGPQDGDAILEAGLLSAAAGTPFSSQGRSELPAGKHPFDEYFQTATPHTPAPRLFELVDLIFQVTCSACCFGQLKRHRMATILSGPYDARWGVVVPPAVQEAGGAGIYLAAVLRAEKVARNLRDVDKAAAQYALTNGHARSVILKTNLRALYHFSRLRMDGHAQWEIRDLAEQMCRQAQDLLPRSGRYLCGKDRFDSLRGEPTCST